MARLPADLEAARRKWRAVRRERPQHVEPVGAGEESVWDYPRPPRLEPARRPVRVEFGGVVVGQTRRALRVCETAGPPVYYIPRDDVRMEFLEAAEQQTFCEWKGVARHWSIRAGEHFSAEAAFDYPEPEPGYEALLGPLAFYPGRVECWLGGERVRPQPGEYYAGWVTDDIKGPFKGSPGSEGW